MNRSIVDITMGDAAAFNPTQITQDDGTIVGNAGLTKREYFAAMNLQGILASGEWSDGEFMARMSVGLADALIEALNKPTLRKDQTKVEGE